MSTAGPNNCGTAADDATIGTRTWANTTNAQGGVDTVYATLQWTNTGVPAFNSVKAVQGGTISGSEMSPGTSLTKTDTWYTVGSSSSLWGLSWTASDINSSNFGSALSLIKSSVISHYIKCTNFGFSVSGTISGIQMEYRLSYIDTSGATSFVAGTMIRTPYGLMPIESIREGDLVYGFDENMNILITKVKATTSRLADDMYVVNGIYTTKGHDFYTTKGWKMAKDLTYEDQVYAWDGKDVSVRSITQLSDCPLHLQVYNFETECHTYFANDHAVHNLLISGGEQAQLDSVRATITYTPAAGKVLKQTMLGGMIRTMDGGF